MRPLQNKKEPFEYIVFKLIKWYMSDKEEYDFNSNNDFSKLKLIKLHFFVCSLDVRLLETFDKFYAMPYGHVESDIYNTIEDLKRYIVGSSGTSIRNEFANNKLSNSFSLDPYVTEMIDNAIEKLKKENADLINYSATSLVDLSHQWFSWKTTYSLARKQDSYSKQIDSDLIRQEKKFFNLETSEWVF